MPASSQPLRAGHFMHGRCFSFALVLHRKTGLPLAGLFDSAGDCHHAFVLARREGFGVDARGEQPLDLLRAGCAGQIVRPMTVGDIKAARLFSPAPDTSDRADEAAARRFILGSRTFAPFLNPVAPHPGSGQNRSTAGSPSASA